jgi:sugar fermentation stimulation protein A
MERLLAKKSEKERFQEMEDEDRHLLRFPSGSVLATLVRREKRFMVEVERDGMRFWAHCNNSGSMLGLLRPGSRVLLSPAMNPLRRLPYTLELIEIDGFWVGVNTLTPNRILRLAWQAGILPETEGYGHLRTEAAVGESRLDAYLEGPGGSLWVEAKNVTLVENQTAYFPDAITLRGQKHLREMMALVGPHRRAACFCLVQRPDAACFSPADFIDPAFSDLFWEAMAAGVEVWPYEATVSPHGLGLGRRLRVHW